MTQTAGRSAILSSWAAWIGALEAKGVAATAGLRPGATDEQIEAVEDLVGAPLPAEARALYLAADGQFDLFKGSDRPKGTLMAPIFGGYEFNSLERMTFEWSSWLEVRKQSSAEELDDFNANVEVRSGHGVKKLYTHALWIPFATDGGGNSLAFDLDPPSGGTSGQIIVIGSDEDERRVLAPSLNAFLIRSTQLLSVGRLTIDAPDDGDPIVFFDIEPGMLQ